MNTEDLMAPIECCSSQEFLLPCAAQPRQWSAIFLTYHPSSAEVPPFLSELEASYL